MTKQIGLAEALVGPGFGRNARLEKITALIDWAPLSNGSYHTTYIFTDDTTDLKPANAAAQTATYIVSPDYLKAAGTALLSGRSCTDHDGKEAPSVAMINQELARRMFGSATNALGRYFKRRDGSR